MRMSNLMLETEAVFLRYNPKAGFLRVVLRWDYSMVTVILHTQIGAFSMIVCDIALNSIPSRQAL